MITDNDRTKLRQAELFARDRISTEIDARFLDSIGFTSNTKSVGGWQLIVSPMANGKLWRAKIGDTIWPSLLRTRNQLTKLIDALEAE